MTDLKIAELFAQLEPKDDATVIQAKDYGTALRRLGASPSQAEISKRISDQSLDHSATVSLELFKTMSEGLSFEPAESVDELLKQLHVETFLLDLKESQLVPPELGNYPARLVDHHTWRYRWTRARA